MSARIQKRFLRMSVTFAWLLLTAGCGSMAPDYEKPNGDDSPKAFKEASADDLKPLSKAEGGTWKTAQPSDQIPRGEWWTVFGDPVLNDLQRKALSANQNLKAAMARVKESRAIQQTVRAQLLPSVDAGFGPTTQKPSEASQGGAKTDTSTLWRAQATFSYEVDLFGRVSDSVAAASAETQQSEALFRSVLLALQADVAQNYFYLRELDAELEVFKRTLSLREDALKFAQKRFDSGQTSELDLARSKSELATAQSEAMTIQRLRAASEHSLAVLLGQPPAQFSMAASPIKPVGVSIPPGLPSSLLERRPDIAAAERAMAAANSRVGVAESAFFPSLTLTGAGGFESNTLGSLFNWSSKAFLLGPLTGTMLNIPIFDAGKRKGNLANARAEYEEDVAHYRQQVLVAFQEVEDNLSSLRILETQTKTQNEAVMASNQVAQISRAQYTEGAVNYLDVIDAERTALQSQRTMVQLSGVQAVATVNLIRALGGGWGDSRHLPSTESVPNGEVTTK
jgi:multidrug efflux system outer membrane protein